MHHTLKLTRPSLYTSMTSIPVVLNLWAVTPLGSHIRYSAYCIFTLQVITAEKLQLLSSNTIIFCLRITTTWEAVLNDHSIRNVENHSSKRVEQPFWSCGALRWISRFHYKIYFYVFIHYPKRVTLTKLLNLSKLLFANECSGVGDEDVKNRFVRWWGRGQSVTGDTTYDHCTVTHISL